MHKERMTPSSLRRRKARRVHESVACTGTYDANQRCVWDEVEHYSNLRRVRSATSALSDVLDHDQPRLSEYTMALPPKHGQIGLVAQVGSRLAGLDILGRRDSYMCTHRRLISSYAAEALVSDDRGAIAEERTTQGLSALMRAMDNTPETHEAPGRGIQVYFRSRELSVAALCARDELVHLAAFPAG